MAITDLMRAGVPATVGPVQPLSGVATVFDRRRTISADLERQVQLELDKLSPGTTTAILNVHTERGVNLVVASRINDRMTGTLYVGKSGWDRPLKQGWEGAVSLRAAWGGK